MNARDLAVKFNAYQQYISSREWARERSSLPRLLSVAPDIAQERRMHRVAQGSVTHPPELAMWTTTEVLLKAHGPIAPIWMQLSSQWNQPGKASERHRCDVFETRTGGKGSSVN
jgi:hypothetical protein